jgi:hypothetical protein
MTQTNIKSALLNEKHCSWHYQPLLLALLLFVLPKAIAQPTVSSLSPTNGFPGSAVTITGTNFNTTPANNIVYFGATRAAVSSASSTSLSVNVPAGATYSPVTVTNDATQLTGYSLLPYLPTFDNSEYMSGTVNFDPKVSLLTPSIGATTGYSSIAIKDIDNDGKPDIVLLKYSDHYIRIYRNISTTGTMTAGSFAAPVGIYCPISATNVYNIAVGDVDGDGKLDIAVNNYVRDTVYVFRNTSTPGTITSSSFDVPLSFPMGGYTGGYELFCVKIADIDGDGKPELVGVHLNSQISILQNTSTSGSISFGSKTDFFIDLYSNPYDIAIGDIDGDGKPDLATANGSMSPISGWTMTAIRNTSSVGSISFSAYVEFASLSHGNYQAELSDIDGDGKLDVVTIGTGSTGLEVYRNTASSGVINGSSFAPAVFFGGSAPVTLTDVDGDAKVDILAPTFGLRNTSTPGSINMAGITGYPVAEQWPESIAAGDLDGDGKPELVIPCSNFHFGSDDTIDIFKNDPLVAPISGSTTLCSGATTTLTHVVSGGTWSSSNPSVASIGSGSGVVTAVSSGTSVITYNLSSSYTTTTVTIVYAATGITGTTTICAGTTGALSDITLGGPWSSSNTSVATIGSGTGIVSGVAAGTSVITYATSCGDATITVTVVPAPAAITGPTSVCIAASNTYSDVTPALRS